MDTALAIRLTAIPLISALTGYVTNYVAVRMLFRPRREIRVAGFSLQGLVPRRRPQIARSIAETVERHLISHDDIRQALNNPAVAARMQELLDARIGVFLKEKLARLNPMIAMFLKDDLVDRIRGMMLDEVLQAMPGMTEAAMESLEETLDFRQLVVEKIEAFDLDTFEQIILRIASRELRAIEILGGVLGLGIGLLTDLLLLA